MKEEPGKELSEKDFIHEDFSQHPFRFWIWLVIVIIATLLLWAGFRWMNKQISNEYQASPFLQVTNRQMSIFLWQNPSYMRINAKNKNGYLPGFLYAEKIGVDVDYADDYVVCPPGILFLYHAWHRLISKEFAPRAIPLQEFKEFISYAEEWQPQYWPGAPESYIKLINRLTSAQQSLPPDLAQTLPLEVQQAFEGWKNFFKEGQRINAFRPTFSEMAAFLEKFPHYKRNYWRNIAGKNYLKSFLKGNLEPNALVPDEELAPFLRMAVYNYYLTTTKPSSAMGAHLPMGSVPLKNSL